MIVYNIAMRIFTVSIVLSSSALESVVAVSVFESALVPVPAPREVFELENEEEFLSGTGTAGSLDAVLL